MVLAALDRVAKSQEPETLGVFCTTDSLVAARPAAPARLPGPLAELGDESVPLPGLDRYLPTRPARLL